MQNSQETTDVRIEAKNSVKAMVCLLCQSLIILLTVHPSLRLNTDTTSFQVGKSKGIKDKVLAPKGRDKGERQNHNAGLVLFCFTVALFFVIRIYFFCCYNGTAAAAAAAVVVGGVVVVCCLIIA
jgi:hypothetical protein